MLPPCARCRTGAVWRWLQGAEGRLVAWLVLATRLPRRVAGALLRRVRRLPVVRALLRALRPAFTIVEARPADLMAAYALYGAGDDADLRPRRPSLTTYVARRGARVVGVVQSVRHPPEDYPYVGHWGCGLAVAGRYQAAGVGETLVRRAIDQAISEGTTELHLTVFSDNQAAIALYQKLGFERVTLPVLEERQAAAAEPSGRRMATMRRVVRPG